MLTSETVSKSDSPQAIAALLTPRGRGAVATVRLRTGAREQASAGALPFQAANGKPLGAQPRGRAVFGRWGVEAFEDVVVCIIDETTIDLHCHGGEAAAARILEDCAQAGYRVEPWQEMVQSQGKLEAELCEALAKATTLRTAEIVLEQASGLLRAEFETILALCDRGVTKERIQALLRLSEFGEHLTRPWKVALAGRPNVGKSSLVNALLGYSRSIVFDQPGTTRDVVTAATAIDGWPIEFLDTAGLREGSEALEVEGIERARRVLREARLLIVLFDVNQPVADDDRALLAAFPDALVIAHKYDLEPYGGPGAWQGDLARSWLGVSSKTGEGVDALLRAISKRLVPEVPPAGTPLPVAARQSVFLKLALDKAERGDLPACRRILEELVC